MTEKTPKKTTRKRGRPPKIIPGEPANVDDLGKTIVAPVRDRKGKCESEG